MGAELALDGSVITGVHLSYRLAILHHDQCWNPADPELLRGHAIVIDIDHRDHPFADHISCYLFHLR